jgi:hypothetical protein
VAGCLEIGECFKPVCPICIWAVVNHSVNLSWYHCFLVLKHPRSFEWLYIIASGWRCPLLLYPWVSIGIWIYIIIVYFLYIENWMRKYLQIRHKFYSKVFPKTEWKHVLRHICENSSKRNTKRFLNENKRQRSICIVSVIWLDDKWGTE